MPQRVRVRVRVSQRAVVARAPRTARGARVVLLEECALVRVAVRVRVRIRVRARVRVRVRVRVVRVRLAPTPSP